MKRYECRFYVANKFKFAKTFEADSYREAFLKAHEYSDEKIKRHFVAIACYEVK